MVESAQVKVGALGLKLITGSASNVTATDTVWEHPLSGSEIEK